MAPLTEYEAFLESKEVKADDWGFEPYPVKDVLFPFQRDIVRWAVRKGRAAVFADCGLGKTVILLEWARQVREYTGLPVLVVSPLAVSGQTVQEACKFGYDIEYCRLQTDASGAVNNITNYEMLANFDMSQYGGVVVDESSILKNFTGKTKKLLIEMAQSVHYRLACTATPSPNDHLELGNHAEFLGIMKSNEMIQRWFKADSMQAGGYSLRKHGESHFWTWVSSWAVALRKPSDIGDYDDTGYVLPDLNFVNHIISVDHSRAFDEVSKDGQMSLLLTGKTSATGMHKEKRATYKERMQKAAEIATRASQNDYVVIWVLTNYEADYLMTLLPDDAVEVRGSQKIEVKRQRLIDFQNGKTRILVTKPKIAAFGLNWQHCGTQIWPSIDNKYEKFYQGYKRSHRFGRTGYVDCHLIYAESEGSILGNLNRKHAQHEAMQNNMVEAMQRGGMSVADSRRYRAETLASLLGEGFGWKLYHGDSAVSMASEPNESVDFIVQSPPFESLYIYSDAKEDLGNSADEKQFYDHYKFILADELRRMKQGAFKAEHCKDLPLYRNRDGAMGLDDFPGRLIQAHLDAGFWFVGWKTVWKDPVIEMQRTKNAGLLWSSAFCQRAERARQGMADYVLIFQKPIVGELPPITRNECGAVSQQVIDRCLDLWTNKGEGLGKHLLFADIPKRYEELAYTAVDSLLAGRLLVCRLNDSAKMSKLIATMKPHRMVFHSRVALTDGTWLVVFRKWVDDMPTDSHVTHDLKAPRNFVGGHSFIGTDGPQRWDSDRDYSIQVWQRYASPVWYDLEGLPNNHPDIWFDIDQTDVLNHRIAREAEDEKHICPLQLGLIERCIDLYTERGDMVSTSFAGVGSEMVTAIKMGRSARGCELKGSYVATALKHLKRAELGAARPTLFDLMAFDRAAVPAD